MRKVLIVTGAQLAAAFPATAAAAPDTTTGTGTQEYVEPPAHSITVRVNAQSNNDGLSPGEPGLNPRGTVFYEQDVPTDSTLTVKVRGDVTCHAVSHTSAVVGAALREPIFGGFQGPEPIFGDFRGLLIEIHDNSALGAGQDVSEVTLTATPSRTCPFDTVLRGTIEKGNYTVRDG